MIAVIFLHQQEIKIYQVGINIFDSILLISSEEKTYQQYLEFRYILYYLC